MTMAEIHGMYMVYPGTKITVKLPKNPTDTQIQATKHRVEWLARNNGTPFPTSLLQEFLEANLPDKSHWKCKLNFTKKMQNSITSQEENIEEHRPTAKL